MNTVWISFFVGLFIGANLTIVLIGILKMAADYDRHMPDIKDVVNENNKT